MENKIIQSTYEAIPYLKAGYILVIVENKTAVCIRDDAYFLMNENWHTKLKELDFIDMFQENTFMVWQSKEEGISQEKDDEYYAWRSKYL